MEKQWKQEKKKRLYFLGLWNHCRWWLQPWNKRHFLLGRKAMTNLGSMLRSRNITLLTKVYINQSCGLSICHIWMWELDHKESEHQRIDAFKLWCWRRLLRVPWTARRSNQSILKEINTEDSLEGLVDAEVEAPMLWPSDEKSWFIGKDPDAGKDRRLEEKGMTEDEMVGRHDWLNGHESEQIPWKTGKLDVLQSMGQKESDMI